ncbi:XRE family transcriptional regulator [Sphingomonas sp. IC081]|uniref:XRE family transcriptional regulator n=1 Tax=Sphingomonas sp. IC081 TaxID=304378 RepID=UPI001158A58A|nr:XRE family transcriptional regulator [Sphingomonas sp. IC081]QDK34753.1 XRE family transcriptional regulator [Sphingomonas sp. IC081]
MAELLGLPLGTYARYESEAGYKKPFLPLDFTRKVASVLADHGVDPADVMTLAGLNENEAEPEARAVEAARPQVQYVPLQLALPNEAALRDMFRSLLVLIPEGATLDEAAEILARRLPTGLSAIGPVLLDAMSAALPAAGTVPPDPATNRHASKPSSRT